MERAVDDNPVMALWRQYKSLPNDDQARFLAALGNTLTADGAFFILTYLQQSEKLRVAQRMSEQTVSQVLPIMIGAACKLARQYPDVPEEELEKLVYKDSAERIDAVRRTAMEQSLAQLKEQRDPKPRNTERDNEIVRLRDIEKKSFGEIPGLLKTANPSWTRSGGKQLTRKAVEKAYKRRKGMAT
jgi:hypothetical protein